ncbi:Site-specific tyrosine recombinase XerD [Candidatus Hepatincolaceae symbiont of Richtersius coronifer]
MATNQPLNNLIKLFLDALKVERGLSENTLSAYTADLKDFESFLNKRKPIRQLNNALPEDVRDYIFLLNYKHFSGKTQSRRISALKQFYSFVYLEKIITLNPMVAIKNPKIAKTLPKFLSEEEVNLLINNAKKYDNPMLYTMLEIMYSTGVRVSELVSLNVAAIIENGNFLLIKGKGNVERVIPLTSVAKEALQYWLKERERFIKKLTSANKMFVFPSNKIATSHITRERFAQLLKILALKCGISYHKVSPHVIRHCFASHILNNGGDLKSIQNMLGHADISTTEIYTHILDSKLKEAVFNNHPLANKLKI